MVPIMVKKVSKYQQLNSSTTFATKLSALIPYIVVNLAKALTNPCSKHQYISASTKFTVTQFNIVSKIRVST
jgi:hypothetical protein